MIQNDCQKCQRERDNAYSLAIDSRRTTEDQAMAIIGRIRRGEIACRECISRELGCTLGRRNAYNGTPWTHWR